MKIQMLSTGSPDGQVNWAESSVSRCEKYDSKARGQMVRSGVGGEWERERDRTSVLPYACVGGPGAVQQLDGW